MAIMGCGPLPMAQRTPFRNWALVVWLGDCSSGPKIRQEHSVIFLLVLVFQNIFWGGFWGLNIPKTVNFDSRTYCNTFWEIFGTSKLFTKPGPVYTPILSQKHFKKYTKNQIHFQKTEFCISGLPESRHLWKRQGPKHPEESFNEILKTLEMRPIP